jgi:hypothetical protein
MLTSVDDLVAIFRSDLSDPELPGDGDDSDSLWSDTEITDWILEAQRELCERVDVLFDASSFSIKTSAGNGLYAVDDEITKLRRGKVAGGRTLQAVSVKELLRRYQPSEFEISVIDWESMTGDPKYMVTDYEPGMVKLVPEPVEIETIELHVYRLPTSDNLEIPNKYRRKLLSKTKHLAYMKDDVDSQNLTKAEYHEAKWEQEILKIDKMFKRLSRGPQVVAYGGI